MVENAPSSIDLQDFQFKLHSKLKIFEYNDNFKFKNSLNLVVAANRYGIVFVGSPNATLEVIQTQVIEKIFALKAECTNFPKRSVTLPGIPHHLAINSDQTLLAVVYYKNECATAIIYNIPSFLSENISEIREIRLSATPGVLVLETGWNPTVPGMYTACKDDGSLGVYNLQENSVDIHELPVAAAAKCFCWSPKGKQLVVGAANGSLIQYKPDLKAVKIIGAPVLGDQGPYPVLSVCWLTNYQFIAVYSDTSNEEPRSIILVVNAPKTGSIAFMNYNDICYSYGTFRPPQFYIIHQPTWNVLLVTSANSMEVGVLGVSISGEPALWQQWNQIDNARAELPLAANHQDTFPIGIAFNIGVTMQLPWGDNQQLPAMPMIHLLSHHGVLCSFSVINTKQGAAPICSPPEPLNDVSGLRHFTIQQSTPTNTPISPQPAAATPIKQEINPVLKPTFNSPAFSPLSSANNELVKPTAQPSTTLFSGINKLSLPTSNVQAQTTQQLPSQGSIFGGISKPALLQPVGTLFSGTQFNPPVQSTNTTTTAEYSFKLLSSNSSSSVGSTITAGSISSTNTIMAVSTPSISTVPSNVSVTKSSPLSTSTNMFGGLSTLNTNKPVSSFETSNFGSLNLVTTKSLTPTLTSSVPPQNITPASKPITISPITSKPDNSQAPQIQTLSSVDTEVTTKTDDCIDNNQLIQILIKDEIKNFQTELLDLFQRCKSIKLDVGTDEEKTNLVVTTETLLEFYKELQDITNSQIAEVHYLKQALMQSFAWYEDAKARHRRYADPNFTSLLQSQELDPVSEKQLADIKHLIYYIEAQLKQVDGFLDNQWADFQDSCKKHIKGKLQTPTLEPIYQALIRQNAILDRQRYLLKDIAVRIKSKNKKTASIPHVMNIANLINDKNFISIDEELQKLKLDHADVLQSRYDEIMNKEKKFTNNKQSKLCSFLMNRNVVHISPKKPKFTDSLLQHTASKLKSSFNMSSSVQRNLTQTFNNMKTNEKTDSFNNLSAEANLSSSNIFSFGLLDNTKIRPIERDSSNQQKLFSTTISTDNELHKPTVSVPLDMIKKTSADTLTSSAPIITPPPSSFNFTLNVTTPNKTAESNLPTFTFNKKITSPIQQPTSFGQITITPVQIKSNDVKTVDNQSKVKGILNTKTSESKTVQPTLFNLPASTATEQKLSQPFVFTVPQTKSATTSSQFATNANIFTSSRDSLDTGFSFGSALSLGQQSTPKSKSVNAISFGQMAQISTTNATSTITTKPVAVTTQFIIPKPAFPQISVTAVISTTPQTSITATSSTINKSETVSSLPSSTTANIFGGSAAATKTFPTFSQEASFLENTSKILELNKLGNTMNTTSSIIITNSNTITTTSSSVPGLIFGSKPVIETEKISVFEAPVTSNTDVINPASLGFSFTQTSASDVNKTISIFSGTAPTTPTTATTTTTSVIFKMGSTPATATIAPTAPTAPTAPSGFSFLQPTVSSVAVTSAAPKISSVFPSSIESKPIEVINNNKGAGDAKTTEGSTFNFESLATAVTSTDNKFSFGNLTVSALSPASSVPTTTTAITNTFSFALSTSPSSTTTTVTTSTSIFGGFNSSIFRKPGTVATTTTTSSFMGQPICSPSSFDQQQNSTNIFGQTTGNIFASKPANLVFGQPVMGGSLFGSGSSSSATPVSTTSIFGQTQSSPFGSSLTSTSSTTSNSIFGQNPTFGTNTATTTSGSIFGQGSFAAPATSSTAGSFSFTQNTGQSSTFGNTGSNSGSIFGAKPDFGQAPAFGQTATFGTPAAFGTNPSGGSIFGSSAVSSTSNAFGSSFGTPSSFGQKPAFGSPPTFGQSSFGSAPSFGGSPTFGSPQRVFGSPVSANTGGTFGSNIQENSTFANLANQSTLGFGSLVQNQPPPAQPQQPQFSGGAQFSSWR